VQSEEAAESRVSLSATSTHARGWYSGTAEPNADADAGANVGLLNHEFDGAAEADEKDGWMKEGRKRRCVCCGIG
jgi:hypothetical protein